jgi:hypothetical protein
MVRGGVQSVCWNLTLAFFLDYLLRSEIRKVLSIFNAVLCLCGMNWKSVQSLLHAASTCQSSWVCIYFKRSEVISILFEHLFALLSARIISSIIAQVRSPINLSPPNGSSLFQRAFSCHGLHTCLCEVGLPSAFRFQRRTPGRFQKPCPPLA